MSMGVASRLYGVLHFMIYISNIYATIQLQRMVCGTVCYVYDVFIGWYSLFYHK